MPIIQRMDHFTVTSPNLAATKVFYERLGLTEGERPRFAFPGLWLYSGDQPILHVISVERMPQNPDGAIDHIAFRASGLTETIALLNSHGIGSKLMRLPRPYNVWQLFFRDPFGAMVELDFDPTETAPADWAETTRPQDTLVATGNP